MPKPRHTSHDIRPSAFARHQSTVWSLLAGIVTKAALRAVPEAWVLLMIVTGGGEGVQAQVPMSRHGLQARPCDAERTREFLTGEQWRAIQGRLSTLL